MLKVLFVCHGNICRSPTAEGVFRALVEKHSLSQVIAADSAGVADYHLGEAPDRRAQAAALKRGIDISRQRARQAVPLDFKKFDYVLAMDQENLRGLRFICPPGEEHKLALMLEFAPQLGVQNVPDPYYGPGQGFEEVIGMIETASLGLLKHLCAKHGLSRSALNDAASY